MEPLLQGPPQITADCLGSQQRDTLFLAYCQETQKGIVQSQQALLGANLQDQTKIVMHCI